MLKILHLDDEASSISIVKKYLNRLSISYDYHAVSCKTDFLKALEELHPDVVFLDAEMPDYSGFAALSAVRQKFPNIAVVIVSAFIDEYQIVDFIRSGATHYILKSSLEKLPRLVEKLAKDIEVGNISDVPGMIADSEDFSSILDVASFGLLVFKEDEVLFLNKRIRNDFNLSTHNAHLKDLLAVVHKDDINKVKRLLFSDNDFEIEDDTIRIRVLDKVFRSYWVELHVIPITFKGEEANCLVAKDVTTQVHALEKDKELLEQMPVGVIVVDKDYVVQFANTSALNILERPKREFVGYHFYLSEFVTQKDLKHLEEFIYDESVVDGAKAEVEIYTPQGLTKFVHVHKSRSIDYDGQHARLITFNDISSRKQAEEKAEQAETLFEYIDEIAVIGTLDGYFLKVNPAFTHLMGYTAEELTAKPYINFIREEDRAFTIAGNMNLLASYPKSISTESNYITKEGEAVVLNWSITPDYRRRIFYGTARNVSKERESEENLLRSEADLKRTLRIANLGSWTYRVLEDTLWWNQESKLIFEVKADYEPKLYDFFDADSRDQFSQALKDCLTQQRSFDLVVGITTPRFNKKWVRVIGELNTLKEGGRIVKGIFQDVTRIRNAELEMIKAKELAERAARSKSDFLSTMSHEIRTPMNAVIGMTHLLMENNPRADQLEDLETLQFSANNLLNLINDILDFSKIESGKLQLEELPIKVESFFKGVYSTFKHQAEQQGIKLEYFIGKDVPDVVLGDVTRIGQIFNNLLGNAFKFTENGSIRFTVKRLAEKGQKGLYEFCVSDTGIGIHESKRDLIFDSFTQANADTTRRYGGTGLGLSISKKLVELYEGDIRVESQLGNGSNFIFTLWLDHSDVSIGKAKEVEAVNAEISIDGKHILVVDDNLVNVKIAQKFLTKWGVISDFALSGKDALSKCENNDYDLILLDLQMPELDGYETARELLRRQNQENKTLTPIVALTAEVLGGVKEKIKDAGMLDIVSKPFQPMQLKKTIAEYCLN